MPALNFVPDPCGALSLTRDGDTYTAVLEDNGFHIATYTGDSPKALVAAILQDEGISSPQHAVWLGRELARL